MALPARLQHVSEQKQPGQAKAVLQILVRPAVRSALALAQEGDCVVIAGKGHEDYQIVGQEKRHFDDREEAGEVLAWLGYRS